MLSTYLSDIPPEGIEAVLLTLMDNSDVLRREFSHSGDDLFGVDGACPSKEGLYRMVYSRDPIVVANAARLKRRSFTEYSHIYSTGREWLQSENNEQKVAGESIMYRLACNLTLPSAVRDWIVRDGGYDAILASVSTDPAFLHSFVRAINVNDDSFLDLYAAIADNLYTHSGTLAVLAESHDFSIVKRVIGNPNVALDTLIGLESRGGGYQVYFDIHVPTQDSDKLLEIIHNNRGLEGDLALYGHSEMPTRALECFVRDGGISCSNHRHVRITNSDGTYIEYSDESFRMTLDAIIAGGGNESYAHIKKSALMLSALDNGYFLYERAMLMNSGMSPEAMKIASKQNIDCQLLLSAQSK